MEGLKRIWSDMPKPARWIVIAGVGGAMVLGLASVVAGVLP